MEDFRRLTLYSYLEESRRPLSCLLFVLPMLVCYEVGVRVVNLGRNLPRINGADAILKHAFQWAGFYGSLLSAGLIVISLLLLHLERRHPWQVRAATLPLMAAESFFVALPIFWLNKVVNWLLPDALGNAVACIPAAAGSLAGLSTFERAVLSLGAGVYEEFVFRMLLVGGGLALLRLVRRGAAETSPQAICVLASALLFAIFHHLPPLGDPFSLRLLAFRTLAGVYFGWIYLSRGFGVSACCHAFYNLLVIGVSMSFSGSR